jgi:hypothetical protein
MKIGTIVVLAIVGSFAMATDQIEVGFLEFQGTEYWDLNNDDVVDLELRDPGKTDAGSGRWYRIDDDYDGRYDREVEFRGKTVGKTKRIRTAVSPLKKLRKVKVTKEWLEQQKSHPRMSK